MILPTIIFPVRVWCRSQFSVFWVPRFLRKHCPDDRNCTLLASIARRRLAAASPAEVLVMGGIPHGTVGARMAGGSAFGSEVLGDVALPSELPRRVDARLEGSDASRQEVGQHHHQR
jgi:hypothetical protein